MNFFAAHSEEILQALLQHLEKNGWARADVEKLVDVYLAFQKKTVQTIYGSVMRQNRGTIKSGLEADIKSLITRKLIQRSVSRLWLLPAKTKIAYKLDPLLAPLLTYASAAFPPRA